LNSLLSNTERQLKSAGTFIGLFNYRYFTIDDKSILRESNSTQKSNNFEWSIGGGYYHTLVINNSIYASIGVVPSIGYIHTRLITRSLTQQYRINQNNLIYRIDAKGAIGYNDEDFFAGFYLNYYTLTYEQANTNVVNYDNRIYYQLSIGFRINAPSFLKKFMDNFNF
jgi:hypothetical protein